MTHDAATASLNHWNISNESGYDISNKFARFSFSASLGIDTIKNVMIKIASTQYPSGGRDGLAFLVHQAAAGVRAFDLRIYMGPSSILYQHGTVVWRTKVLESFVQLAQYINSQPRSEVYILRLSHFRGSDSGNMETYKHLAYGIRDIFGQLLCTRRDWLRATVGELSQTPVIMIADVPPAMSSIFSYAWLHDSRVCYDDDYEAVKRMRVGLNSQDVIRYCIARINSFASAPPPSKLIELQAHLQFVMPNGEALFKNPQAIDLKYSTEKSYLNNDVIRLLKENPWRGIVAFDFYSADLTPYIVAINKKNTMPATAEAPAA